MAFATPSAAGPPNCDADNGDLLLPPGFCALVVADNIGPARHIAVRSNGDIYVALASTTKGGSVVALRDTDGDGRADVVRRFGDHPGTGIALQGNYLYASSATAVYRYPLKDSELVPTSPAEMVVSRFPVQNQHDAKALAFDDKGWMYVDVGAPSNACQKHLRTPGSTGLDPCPQRKRQAGIWRFRADRIGQTQKQGERFATGIRNAVALAWNSGTGHLYAVQHGRDQLHELWPTLYTAQENAELPAEELFQVDKGDDFGWPYCYYDNLESKKVLAPEYGGDGTKVGRCAEFEGPIMAFPAHWAPNALLFYTGSQFPERYQGGAFIAFHGSWNRAPLPQAGYAVVFVPFMDGAPYGNMEVFAEGFAGAAPVESPGEARYRPSGLAQGPDGSLYIADSQQGRIWRVLYRPAP